MQGYAINENGLATLNRIIEIQSNIIVGALELDSQNILKIA